MNKDDLISFEKKVEELWLQAKIPYPVHFSGGNEDQLIKIFKRIHKGHDYIFSTHRNHYHYLLVGGNPDKLMKMVLQGDSMHVYDRDLNFITSAIVAGCPGIAAGVSYALKMKKSRNKVWCFLGDGAEDEGHFYEAVRFVDGHKLPCTFIIEDNNRSVETPKNARYGTSLINWPDCVERYEYEPTYPHVGNGIFINFKEGSTEGNSF